ncbi:MAG: hypothetical protein ACRCSC_00030, partial [Lactococcus garvieae]
IEDAIDKLTKAEQRDILLERVAAYKTDISLLTASIKQLETDLKLAEKEDAKDLALIAELKEKIRLLESQRADTQLLLTKARSELANMKRQRNFWRTLTGVVTVVAGYFVFTKL